MFLFIVAFLQFLSPEAGEAYLQVAGMRDVHPSDSLQVGWTPALRNTGTRIHD